MGALHLRKAKAKAASQRGASITFALLLFLVCAVISSVVIVAATAASGRMSGQTDMDERYYAVTAVAGKLCKLIDGKEVVVTYDKSASDMSAATVKDSAGTDIATSQPLLTTVSKAVVKGGLTRTQLTQFKNDATTGKPETTCTVFESVKEGGLLTFDISAQGGSIVSGTYTLTLTFAPNMKTTTSGGKANVAIAWKLLSAKKNRAAITSKPTNPAEGG